MLPMSLIGDPLLHQSLIPLKGYSKRGHCSWFGQDCRRKPVVTWWWFKPQLYTFLQVTHGNPSRSNSNFEFMKWDIFFTVGLEGHVDPMSSTSSGSSGTSAPTEPAAPLTSSPCPTPAGQQVKLMHVCHTNCPILTVHQYRSYIGSI